MLDIRLNLNNNNNNNNDDNDDNNNNDNNNDDNEDNNNNDNNNEKIFLWCCLLSWAIMSFKNKSVIHSILQS